MLIIKKKIRKKRKKEVASPANFWCLAPSLHLDEVGGSLVRGNSPTFNDNEILKK